MTAIDLHNAICDKIASYGYDKFEPLDNEKKHALVQQFAKEIDASGSFKVDQLRDGSYQIIEGEAQE